MKKKFCVECGKEFFTLRYKFCEECKAEINRKRSRVYAAANPAKIAQYNLYRQTTVSGRATVLLNSAKVRAKKYKREINLTHENVKSMLSFGVCWATGFKLILSGERNTKNNPFSPSLDRRNNKKGYTLDNVQLVCTLYNNGKGEYDELDFIAMCMAVAQTHANNTAAIERLKELRNAAI